MSENSRSQPRIVPLEPPFAPAVAEELARWQPPGKDPIALFRTLTRHLPLARTIYPLGRYFLGNESSLAIRDREIVIDRVCARCACEYEWGYMRACLAAPRARRIGARGNRRARP